MAALEGAEPAMPVEDRAADTWEPLITIADHAGGTWPDRARAAVVALTEQAAADTNISDKLRLLADCRTAFGTDTAITTNELLARLNADPEAPWPEYGPHGITGKKLATMLADYEIRSVNVRIPGEPQSKGYQRAAFTDAWNRYCPGPNGVVPDPETADPRGVSVPTVPSSFSQVSAGRIETVGRMIRPSKTIRPSLTSRNDLGTDGTDTPPLRVVNGPG
jgi:hypothetical protein